MDITTYCDIYTCEDCPRYGDDCDGDKRVEHTDTISRADAIDCCECHGSQECKDRIKALPSADAKPTVIRSRTLMPTKDFKEWAKRVRETNPNVIVIPCDAEVVSADAEWIPIATEPNTSDHVLVTYKWDGDDYEVSELDYWVTEYEAEKGNEECKWLIDHVTAWMPLPKPYKESEDEK